MADTPNSQFGADVEHKSLDIGTPAWAVKPGPAAVPPIPPVDGSTVFSEDFEGPLWSQISLVSSDWTLINTDSHSPTHSYQSLTTPQTVSSFVINDFSFSPQLSFWYKIVIPFGVTNARFEVLFDGVPVLDLFETPVLTWTRFSVPTNFAFNIEFRFSNLSNFSNRRALVDDIVFGSLDTPGVPGAPAHPLIYAPLHLNDDDRLLVDLDEIAISGTVDTRTLDCSTDSVEVCQGTDPWNISGTVSVNEPVTVDAINLDVRDLIYTTDSVTAVQVLPYVVVYLSGSLANGTQTAVAAAAVQIAAANLNRKAIMIQNVGLSNVRVGVAGVTSTTGVRLVPNQIMILEMPHCPTNAIFAIREGAVSSTVFAQEIT